MVDSKSPPDVRRQISQAVLMIRPSSIRFNPDTAVDNVFQRQISNCSLEQIRSAAIEEFDRFVDQLQSAGVRVIVGEVQDDLDTPDAVFPNNWISFHEDGTAVLYPMMAPSRRLERRSAIVEQIRAGGYSIQRIEDLGSWESKGMFLEGTGSLVLDRVNRLAFASLSARTDELAVRRWCEMFGYEPIVFRAEHTLNGRTKPIYHTNVLMGIGETWAVVCLESITTVEARSLVRDLLASSGRHLVEISSRQMEQFAGNVIQVCSADGCPVSVTSQSAWNSLSASDRHWLARGAKVLSPPIETIEACGGGSVRCMMAEVFLPRNSS